MTKPPPTTRTSPPVPDPPVPEIKDGVPPRAEQQQLAAFFAEAERKQVDFLDEAGKRIIELTTLLLGVLFTVVAFGDTYPPPYLADNPVAKLLSLVILACYVVAMLLGLRTVHPRDYARYRYNLDGMREELDRILANKKRSLFWAGLTFWAGSGCLALLIGIIIMLA
ncbi:hypothetical protein EYB53_010820 [Candidatus Chloroploca sp. M-50]|uniref:Integral membrane protein n=1 Tax=Candidatus Chloroploca mongolica TaxID=2528176 RepID=A0ABS4D9T5_9CHLR|nr:hypothetical protein [Candidatus Chloroploca mongolica]MBP1466198.1 hypothetical protein [Candidatus Chloroploca mongolica]